MKDIDVVICGYYGFGNLGDELLLEACLTSLTEASVRLDAIAILSASEKHIFQATQLQVFNRWSPKDVFKALRKSKSLLLGGGGLFQDSTSILSCFYYWCIVCLARLLKCKVWAVGQSIGPLNSSIARLLTRSAFKQCCWVSVRDEKSLHILQEWGICATLTADIVLSLEIPVSSGTKAEPLPRLLLNLRPWSTQNLYDITKKVVEYSKEKGYVLQGIALSLEDYNLYKEIQGLGMLPEGDVILVESLAGFLDVSKNAVGAVGMRLHFTVLALIANLPLFSISYDPKVAAFAERWGIPYWPDNVEIHLSLPDKRGELQQEQNAISRSFKEALLSLFLSANNGFSKLP